WIGPFACRNPHGALNPLGRVDGGEPLLYFRVAPPFQPHQVPMFPGRKIIEVFLSDHAAITHEHNTVEPKSLMQIADDLLHRAVVHGVAGPDVMSDRPASHHDDADDDLYVVWLAIAAVAVLGEVGWSDPLEVGAGDVVEHQVRL